MHSNIFLSNKNNSENIKLFDNQKANLYLILNEVNDIKKTINLTLKNNNVANIYCLILANKCNKSLEINVKHIGNNSTSNIYIKGLANNKADIKVNCISSCQSRTNKNAINQTIDGLIFDNASSIQALPCLDINVNDIEAKHTVNIGQISPEIIFYFNTKGLSELATYRFFIDNFVNDLKPILIKQKLDINKDIKSLIGGNHE